MDLTDDRLWRAWHLMQPALTRRCANNTFDAECASRTESLQRKDPRRVASGLRAHQLLPRVYRGRGALREPRESGNLLAACFDMFAIEPATDDRLLRIPNFLSAPHIGVSAEESRLAMARAAIQGLTNHALVEAGQFDDV